MANVLHPSRYHGFSKAPPYFEGWYYKLVSENKNHRFAIIPGVFLAEEKDTSHCFIQVFDSEFEQVRYHRYPFDSFTAEKDKFKIQIGTNIFTAEKIKLAIDDDLGKVQGSLNFTSLNRWPESFISPGAMGWFAWVPFMECYHGVVSMDHAIQGELDIDGQIIDFSGGRGYIEKDWGKQFPSTWIWGQSNHFEQPGISIMLSVAVIPWLGGSFGGFIIGLLYQGRIYRFATYNRSKIQKIAFDDQKVSLVVINTKYRLEIQALRAEGGLLQAPTTIEMGRRIIETLNAKINIRFSKGDGELIYEGTGENAGLETVGDLDQLMTMVQ